jgi:hypothetical protein
MRLLIATLSLGIFASLMHVQAQSEKAVTKAFTDCLESQARRGSYTSSDGGKSAIQLMGKCEWQWHAWQDLCEAGRDTDGDCTVKAVMLAQSTLKLLGK